MPRYGKAAGKSVKSAMRRKKHGDLTFWKSRQRRPGEKPEAGDRDWAVRGPQKGRKSSQKEILARRNCLSVTFWLLPFTASCVLRYGSETKSNSCGHGRQSGHRCLEIYRSFH